MVSLSIITLLTPFIPIRYSLWLSPVQPLLNNSSKVVNYALPLIILSGLLGTIIGFVIPLHRTWDRPMNKSIRFVQDLLAYDFYLDKIYQYTVVAFVSTLAKITNWFDRYIIDGLVNLVSLVTIFSGNTLKYNTSGQSQFYVLTILIGVALLIWLILSGQWHNIVNY